MFGYTKQNEVTGGAPMWRIRRMRQQRDQLLDRWMKASPEEKRDLILQWMRLSEEIEEAAAKRLAGSTVRQ